MRRRVAKKIMRRLERGAPWVLEHGHGYPERTRLAALDKLRTRRLVEIVARDAISGETMAFWEYFDREFRRLLAENRIPFLKGT